MMQSKHKFYLSLIKCTVFILLTHCQEDRARYWVLQCSHSSPALNSGIADCVETQDAGGVVEIPISTDVGVVAVAVHSCTIERPGNIWLRIPSRCITPELHLLASLGSCIPSRDIDCSTFWGKYRDTKENLTQGFDPRNRIPKHQQISYFRTYVPSNLLIYSLHLLTIYNTLLQTLAPKPRKHCEDFTAFFLYKQQQITLFLFFFNRLVSYCVFSLIVAFSLNVCLLQTLSVLYKVNVRSSL